MATWTMSEARRRFRELLDRATAGDPTMITRRGEVTAVVIGPQDFQRLRTGNGTFVDALDRFRATIDVADLRGPDAWDDLRDRSPGRPVDL